MIPPTAYPITVIYREGASVYDMQHKTRRGREGYALRNPQAIPVDVFCSRCGERCWRTGGCS